MMDLATTTNKVREITLEAGEIAKKYFRQADLSHHSKGGSDFVTKGDLEVDAFLREKLAQHFPTTQFLTEETAPPDFMQLKNAENLWIIDPIDGTTNFSRGDEHFAISIALYDKGEIKIGIVYLPIEGKMYFGNANDDNAYCNEEKLKVSELSDLKVTSVAYDWAWDLSDRVIMQQWVGKFMTTIRQPRSLGSAAADLAKVALGEIDGYVNIGIKPWDIAAASLLVTKAGGKITKADGSEWNVFDKELLATNGIIHEKFLALLSA